MAHLPFFQFYPADWIQDTRFLSHAARGAWIDLLCAMWVAPERGKLVWTQDQFENFLGVDRIEATEIWNELIASGVGEFDFDDGPPTGTTPGIPQSRNSTASVTIMSRRMYREEHERSQARTRQSRKRHGAVTEKSRRIYQKSEVRSHISDFKDPAPLAPSADLTLEKKNGRKSMGKSMGLSEELKEQTDRLYNSDPVKFKRLAAWVAQGRKHEYLETDMAEALRQFWDYRMVDEWYPYLDTCLSRVVKDRNRDLSAKEHFERKAEEARSLQGPALSLVRGLADAKKA